MHSLCHNYETGCLVFFLNLHYGSVITRKAFPQLAWRTCGATRFFCRISIGRFAALFPPFLWHREASRVRRSISRLGWFYRCCRLLLSGRLMSVCSLSASGVVDRLSPRSARRVVITSCLCDSPTCARCRHCSRSPSSLALIYTLTACACSSVMRY